MASPCEIFIDTKDKALAQHLCDLSAKEALRIEHKFSRYRSDNIIHDINNSEGKTIEVDEETALLLNFSAQCYNMSDGLFDISSGVLGQAWKFDQSDKVPSVESIKRLLPLVGWEKVHWKNHAITLPKGMRLDLGGIGKEYAVDKTLALLTAQTDNSVLVNFGGDLHTSGPRENKKPWIIAIENPHKAGKALKQIRLSQGAITTSGDSQRFLLKNNKRYSHVLNPKTGWPVVNAPHSVTVAANNCIEAGILSTLAMLNGEQAESFLEAQGVVYWCER
jgi:thiamine biosynthesis lipoprotein